MSSNDESAEPAVEMTTGGDLRFWLRFSDHDVELTPGEITLGRSPRCQILLDDPMVSRRHARLVLSQGVVTLEDLGSVNGVLLNGQRLERAQVLKSGDRVVIGHQAFQLHAAPRGSGPPVSRQARFSAQTLSGTSRDQLERSDATHQSDAFELLTGVVEKVLTLGRGDEAERILGNYLRGLLQSVRAGGYVDPEMAEKAAAYAVRIAEATGKGSWVDYAFEFFTLMKEPLPGSLVERLYTSLRGISAINLGVYRRYLEVLRTEEPRFGPTERFVTRRIRGLEALAATK